MDCGNEVEIMSKLSKARRTKRTKIQVTKTTKNLSDTVKLNVNMDRNEYRELKRYAVDHDLTVSVVVKAAIHDYLSI